MNDKSKTNGKTPSETHPAETHEPLNEDLDFFGDPSEFISIAPKPEARQEPMPRPAPAAPEPLEHGETWERPAPMERDHHYKAWMMFIGIILLLLAFFQPLKVMILKSVFKPPVVSAVRNAREFIALAYNGVEESPAPGSSNVSTAMFKEQMKMLADGGYNPVSLQEIRDFYKDGRLLPDKAVLLTFEQAKRGTYNEVREVLQSYRWPAVMGVNTLAVRSMNQESLIWPLLREMNDIGFWDLAAESYLGFNKIDTAENDAEATFFTSPMWITAENRYELPSEFETRIDADHQSVADDFQREVKTKPIAFFFPLGNYGQYDERAQMVRTVNLRQVEKHYDLGFTVGMLALNTENSDPRRLNRLLVNPSWSPNAFISMVDSFWPKPWSEDYEKSIVYNSSSWLGDWGEVISRNDVLILRAVQPLDPFNDSQTGSGTGTTGAKAWLIGSDTFKDGNISLLFNMRHGRFGVYLRSTNRGEYIFISIDERGQVSARQKLQDVDELILATDTLETDVSVSHNLAINLRDNLMFVHVDGTMLFGGRIVLRGESHSGLIGASVWDQLVGVASTEVISTRLAGRRDALVTWAQSTGRNIAYLNRWLNENVHRFAVISPPWIDVVANGPATAAEWDAPSIALLAASNSARIMPRIRVSNVDALMKVIESDIAEKASEKAVDGVFVDASKCDEGRMPPLVSWLARLNSSLQPRKLALCIQLPPGVEKLSSSINIVKIIPGVTLVGEGLASFELPAERAMPVVSVPPSDLNETVKYYYQVANVLAEANDISDEAHNEELRQNGFESFAAADYDEAIVQWTKWSAEDAENAEPYSLIGDAYLKKGDKKLASEFYAASLEKNPGQISLAIRQSQLLFDMGLEKDSNALIDTYARTFPDDPQIAIAQARRLADSRRRGEARDLMQNLVASQPQNIEARLVLQNYLDEPSARYENMHQLLAIGGSSDSHLYGFAQDIIASELLTIPESTIFFPFIRNITQTGSNKRTHDIFESLLPVTNSIIENFSENYLSDAWIPWNGMHSSYSGKYELHANASVSEAFLRLKKSELLRDGVISVTIDESVGAFWLYARRSSRSMLRFGYDNDGYIRMQTWYDGKLRTSESQPWLRPPGEIRLSLEVRGDGAMGFQNGAPLFNTRIKIPKEVCYGWWSIAPYSPNLGSAKASILRIEVSPLPSGLALIPALPSDKIPAMQEMLRRNVRDISVIAPVAFIQNPNGTVPTTPNMDMAPYKLFCAFHRLRLVPVVELPYYSIVKPVILSEIIRKHHYEGLIVRVTSMPPESWFKEMEREMEGTSGNLIVIQSTQPLWPHQPGVGPEGALEEFVRLRGLSDVRVIEIQRGNLILPPIKEEWEISPLPAQEWTSGSDEEKRSGIQPRIIVCPTTELLAAKSVEEARKLGDIAYTNRIPPIAETIAAHQIKTETPPPRNPAPKQGKNGYASRHIKQMTQPLTTPGAPLHDVFGSSISNTLEMAREAKQEALQLKPADTMPAATTNNAVPLTAPNALPLTEPSSRVTNSTAVAAPPPPAATNITHVTAQTPTSIPEVPQTAPLPAKDAPLVPPEPAPDPLWKKLESK